jgi:integrase/recombinase XerD
MSRTTIPKARRLPNVFNRAQLIDLFKAVDDADVMLAIVIATFCGLRIGEVCSLKKENIDFERKVIKIVNGKLPGKTLAGHGKDRIVPIPQKILAIFQMRCDYKEGDHLFESTLRADANITSTHLLENIKQL